MGKIKEYIYELAELAAQGLAHGVEPQYIDRYMQEEVKSEDAWNFYVEHQDIITSMAIEILDDQDDEDDEGWTDPAGGTHYPGEDPAAMYESESIFMPFIEDFE